MSMFFTRDAWDEARDARIAEIGLEAYEKETKERIEKWNRENPGYISATEPHVRRMDIIATWREEGKGIMKNKVFEKEFYVTRITEDGKILGKLITQSPMQNDPKYQGAEHEWEYGQYKRISSAIGEY